MRTPGGSAHRGNGYDYVVVGAGTAGSAVASRLSERPDVRVLLVEAGPADGPELMSVAAAWPALLGSEVDWNYKTVVQSGLGGTAIPYPRGKVLGGSSGINVMMYQRGHRAAIDAWVTAGATGWEHDDLLPYYRRSERTKGFDARYRGVALYSRGQQRHHPGHRRTSRRHPQAAEPNHQVNVRRHRRAHTTRSPATWR